MTTHNHLQKLTILYTAQLKATLLPEEFDRIQIGTIKHLIPLLAESVPFQQLLEPAIMYHVMEGLRQQWQPEEILMHVFLLSVYRLYVQGNQHPLEIGIIRQKILSLLPVFEQATLEKKIQVAAYDRNADALAQFADNTDEINAILPVLSKEFHRFDEKTDE